MTYELCQTPKPCLLDFASQHLKPIDYDRRSDLHYKAHLKANLPAPEAQELAAPEGASMQTITDVYDVLHGQKEKLQLRSVLPYHPV